ncbi:MAG: type II secretion system minor pseudopilin GspH [Legionella sp.]|nr:type II secretion system minor pseudopilin GspH [Legionella sp.]
MTSERGFSLIEIMVVIIIIGVTVGFAMIAFGDFGESRRLLFAAEQLSNTLELAQQQAILETSTLGLKIDDRGYQILKFKDLKHWTILSNKGVFKMNYFPKNTILKLNISKSKQLPTILINASGDMTPFVLSLGTPSQPDSVTLIGEHNGNLILRSGSIK